VLQKEKVIAIGKNTYLFLLIQDYDYHGCKWYTNYDGIYNIHQCQRGQQRRRAVGYLLDAFCISIGVFVDNGAKLHKLIRVACAMHLVMSPQLDQQ
jgi:hypothetical protein